jgi:hypothetical protein
MIKPGTVGMTGYEWVYTRFSVEMPEQFRGLRSGYGSGGGEAVYFLESAIAWGKEKNVLVAGEEKRLQITLITLLSFTGAGRSLRLVTRGNVASGHAA